MKILLASDNAGKIREFNEMVSKLDVIFVPQSDYKIAPAIEDALTFIENALIKARQGAAQSGLSALADDSGLVVDALNGQPGIHSARYAGLPTDPDKNIDKLLKALENVPDSQRTARYYSVIAFVREPNDPAPIIAQGVWEGRIGHQKIGSGGFGYDPVFWVPSLNCTAAELSPSTKNAISHRGKAMRTFLDFFLPYYRHHRQL